jgi:hypothetical protein
VLNAMWLDSIHRARALYEFLCTAVLCSAIILLAL